MANKILGKTYFQRRDTVTIAKSLIGKYLVRRHGGAVRKYMITEAEAYDGFKDKASHAHRGKTARNKIMFGPAGNWYVYFTYGMHWMLNIVTGPENYPAAILTRGIKSGQGNCINGPARLTKALHIKGKINGKPADKKTGLWIEDRGEKIKPSQIQCSPRIGVAYAGPVWSMKNYRFELR